ncbi:MAG: tripartite tricarboxylate transporter TctB family protein [Thermodesulfobacteriota bacterium]
MTPNRFGAFLLIAISLAYGYFTLQQPKAQALGDPGLTLFPWILTLFLLFLSGLLLVQDLRGLALPKRFSFAFTPAGVRSAIGLTLIFVYICVMPYIGFFLSSVLLFGSIMWLVDERRPLIIFGFSCGVTLLLFLFFGVLFQIPLPKGTLLQEVFLWA